MRHEIAASSESWLNTKRCWWDTIHVLWLLKNAKVMASYGFPVQVTLIIKNIVLQLIARQNHPGEIYGSAVISEPSEGTVIA